MCRNKSIFTAQVIMIKSTKNMNVIAKTCRLMQAVESGVTGTLRFAQLCKSNGGRGQMEAENS